MSAVQPDRQVLERRWGRLRLGSLASWLGAFGVAMAVGLAYLASGMAADTASTLIVIGFSPDRSQLLTALVIVIIAVGAAAFVVGGRSAAILGGAVGFVAAYHHTFDSETRAALQSSGADGTFDPTGWALTLVTVVATVLLVGWAIATLSLIARREVARAVSDLRALARDRRLRAHAGRPAAVVAVVILLALTTPVLADMLNYEPDVDMRTGTAVVGLTGSGPGVSLPPGTTVIPPNLLLGGGVITPAQLPGQQAPRTVLSNAQPWQAWRPSGAGQVETIFVPAAWGPAGAMNHVSVYLPPGYPDGARRYPVLYELPWSIFGWQKGVGIQATLDNLIDSGAIPAAIFVFPTETGGPFPDSECADTFDGREWYASWIIKTVVPTIDARYQTIASPSARATMGFSQGAFCAAMLATRNPTVFGTAISFSGYFQAGIRSGSTPNAFRPFGGSAALEAGFSPIQLAPAITPSLRPFLFFELSAGPTEPFYGPQYAAFARILDSAGIPVALFPTPLGHAWAACRVQLPAVLETWAARMTALGVFGRLSGSGT